MIFDKQKSDKQVNVEYQFSKNDIPNPKVAATCAGGIPIAESLETAATLSLFSRFGSCLSLLRSFLLLVMGVRP